ncbi:MAG TPA: SGNH/GDSL hydrolase family protein [Gemmatimonadaceae bacterium]|nr:SGNH/GDSL hydrolase family protein [Gemmatimonadaceae bacterium]
MNARRFAAVLAVAALAACADNAVPPTSAARSADDLVPELVSEGLGVFQRYVSIGTSISMGVQGDGVYAATQETSWPAQLARLAHRELTLPLIQSPGCAAPFVAPLITGKRLSGESAGLPFLQRQCAPNEPGVVLPAANVAIDGARTIHALTATPENPDPGHATQYPRVLPPGMSQVTAMESQNPKIVSVELGGNEVLGASHGFYYPGATVVPVSVWEPQYREVVARVDAAAKHGLLVGLVDDVRSFPAFRTGAEFWNARATFAPFNVVIAADCENSTNLLFVPYIVPVAAATGAFYNSKGWGPYTQSCADSPAPKEDYILDAAGVAATNAQLAAMNAVIKDEAQTRGFAYFPLGALYEGVATKPAFNATAIMTTAQPYGPYVSLDGIHPSAEGARVLADAAATALNATYNFGIPTSAGALAVFARR